ncbi:MAG: hypothetical protein JXB39_08930 [Deltaproteobacteria bacterium]|nr:hypothetical protein [Deltaproteobacteria bacterium]
MIGPGLLFLGGCLARSSQVVGPLAAPDEVREAPLGATPSLAGGHGATSLAGAPPSGHRPCDPEANAGGCPTPGDGFDAFPDCGSTSGQPLRAVGVTGALSREAVLAAVLANLLPVRACVEDTLLQTTPGQVVVRFSVTPEGRVSRSSVASDTTGGDGRLADCLAHALARTVFPPAEGPTWICWPVNVQVP